MNNTSVRTFVAAALVLTTGAGAVALGQSGERHLVEAKRLLGVSAVQNEQGKRIGQVEDIVLERGSDKVAYIVVSVDPGWFKGEKLYAVPWSAASIEPGWNTIRFNITPAQLQKAPGFSNDRWPDMDSATWQRSQNAAFATAAMRNPDEKDFSFRRLSKLIGTKVENARNEDFGKVANILIDDRDGRVSYALVSQGGVLGVGDKTYPVPWSSIQLNAWKDRLVVNASKEDLQRFLQQPVDQAQLENRTFADRVAGVFGGGSAAHGASGTGGSMPAHRDDGTFADDAVTRISGEIVAVTMPGTTSSNEPVRLRVKTEGNREFRVEAAPRSFLDNRIQLERGKQITVTGSLRHGEHGEVLIAKELTIAGGQKIALRDDQGRPLWSGPDFMTGTTSSGSDKDKDKDKDKDRDRDRDRGTTRPQDQSEQPGGNDARKPAWKR